MTDFVSVCRICVNMGCVLGSVPLTWLECTSKAGLLHIVRYGNVLGQHYWGSGEVSSFFINGFKHSPNSMRNSQWFCFYILGGVTGVVTKVKVGVLKNVAIAKGHLDLSGCQRIC